MTTRGNRQIPVLKVRYAKAFLRALDERGFDGQGLWLSAGWNAHILDDAEAWMPVKELCRFLQLAEETTNYVMLGLDAGIAPRRRHSEFSQLVLYAPTLYQSLNRLCSNSFREDTSARFRLRRDDACYWMDCGSIDAQGAGIRQIETYRYTAILEVIRFAAGADWLPARLDFQGEARPQLLESPYLAGVEVRFGTPGLKIYIPPLLLSRPMFDVPDVPLQRTRFAEQPLEFFDTLLEVVRYHVLAHQSEIGRVASGLGMSQRTLQRRLADHGMSFTRLLERVRGETAQEWLNSTDRSIADIADALDYRHGTHFSRAFRRVCGISPREYRKHIRA